MESEAKLLAMLEADIAANRLILPSLPDVALEVARISRSPDVSINELAGAITRDPALTARLLKVANSASMRGPSPVDNVKSAIQRLGLRLVCSLVNSLAILQAFNFGGKRVQQLLEAFSRHSLDVAARSHALAAEYTAIDPSEAMLAGLIHDIGKLPLLRRARDWPDVDIGSELFDSACRKLHGRVGAMVLQSWEFSSELIAVARDHDDLSRIGASHPDVVDVVIAANLLAHGRPTWGSVPAIKKLGLEHNDDPVPQSRYEFARNLLGA